MPRLQASKHDHLQANIVKNLQFFKLNARQSDYCPCDFSCIFGFVNKSTSLRHTPRVGANLKIVAQTRDREFVQAQS